MLTSEELRMIEAYVDDRYFDKQKLVRYLNLHSVVGNEVFAVCDRNAGSDGKKS